MSQFPILLSFVFEWIYTFENIKKINEYAELYQSLQHSHHRGLF